MDIRTLALVCCLVLAGCAAPAADDRGGSFEWPEDPPSDRLGWEAGYWYNESIDVDQSDGLDAEERERLVARTMARVERIRGLEFEERVPVSVISRSEFQNRSRDVEADTPKEQFREQVWEAPMLVGENRTVGAAFAELYSGNVLGFYSPKADRIVVVSDNETPTIDRATLAHELVHALQDQHFSLLGGADSRDERLARQGVTEGDANYVEALYEERCTAGEGKGWECIDRPDRSGGGQIADRNVGVYLTVIFPYSDGPQFVHRLRGRGGWAAVNDLYRSPPESTEQLVHPEKYPEERPADVRVPDRSNRNWERYELDRRSERLGEVSVFSMFWYQRGLNRSSVRNDTGPYSTYNYAANVSAGWAGDSLVPYRSDGGENGYVWRLRWDTAEDAREFETAYRTLLTEQLGGREVRENVYRVPDESPYGDAFRVRRTGKTVTIVNAPRVGTLDGVHPPAETT